jgi:hypothetical protein
MSTVAAEATFVHNFVLARTSGNGMIAVMHTLPIILACAPSEVFVATMVTFGCGEADLEKVLPNFRQTPEMALVATAIDALQSRKEQAKKMNNMLHTLIN